MAIEESPDVVRKEQLDVDRKLIDIVASKLERAVWSKSHLRGVFTLHNMEPDLVIARKALWNALVSGQEVL
jgi:hypothetical protein